jgi:hypothetical protein
MKPTVIKGQKGLYGTCKNREPTQLKIMRHRLAARLLESSEAHLIFNQNLGKRAENSESGPT